MNKKSTKISTLLLASTMALTSSVAPLGAINSNNIGETVCETSTPSPTSTTPSPTRSISTPTPKPVSTPRPTQTIKDEPIPKATAKPRSYSDGWLLENTNIRKAPSLNSEKYTVFSKGTKVKYCNYNTDWCIIQYKNTTAYVYKKLISSKEVKVEVSEPTSISGNASYKTYYAPKNGMKTFMSYKAITSKRSPQYKLQKKAYNGNYGIRQVDGRYCVAVGSAYTTEIGTYIDLVLKNGTVIPCILADCKADKDTDSTNRVHSIDGSLAEFVIVGMSSIPSAVRQSGSFNSACPEWNSEVAQIRIYNYKTDF